MPFIAYIFLSVCCFGAALAQPRNHPTPVLDYHLSWDGKSSDLTVVLRYTPATNDSTVFSFGKESFGGQLDIFNVVHDITGSAGDSLKIVSAAKKIVVYHTRPRTRQLTYKISGQFTGNPRRALYNELFRPVINNGSLYLLAPFLFMDVANHANTLTLQWDHYPRNATYLLSVAPGAKASLRQTLSQEQARSVLIVMGDKLAIKRYNVHHIPYYAVTSTADTTNAIETELAPFFSAYFPSLRDFWQDDDTAYYYLCVLPLQSAVAPAVGGFSWGSGFNMRYAGKFDNSKRIIVAHETSHYWIGQKIVIGKEDTDNQWFTEGLNDYVCLINSTKSGIFDAPAFLKYLNETNFKPHYTSPNREAHNDSIAANYWLNKDFEKLPYRRGLIYFFYLDNQIRLASNGTKTLRDLLIALYQRSKALKTSDASANLKLTDFIELAGNYISKERIERDVKKHMLEGKVIDFNQVSLWPTFTITMENQVPVIGLAPGADLKQIYRW